MIRTAGQIVVVVTLALFGAGCSVLPGSSDDDEAGQNLEPPTAEQAAELLADLEACRAAAPILDAIVWLDLDVTPEAVTALEDFLIRSPFVTGQRYIDTDATYRQFTEYFADEPEIIDLVEPEQLPTSFEVSFPEAADRLSILAISDEIEILPGVDSVEPEPNDVACPVEAEAMTVACDVPPTSFLIWIDAEAAGTTVTAVSTALANSDLVDEFQYTDTAESYEEFVAAFEGQSDIVGLVDPEQIPTSFTVDFVPLDEPADERLAAVDQLRTKLEALDGVSDVEAGPFQALALCRSAELDTAEADGTAPDNP